jgi:hypothetical protein
MSNTKFYIELSSDIEELLANNQVTLADILQKENIDADVLSGAVPYQQEEGVKTKEIVTIILASSASIAIITLAITNFLKAWHQKPIFVECDELEPIKNDDGTILLNDNGEPYLRIVKKHKMIEPDKIKNKMDFEISYKNLTDIVIRFKSEDK